MKSRQDYILEGNQQWLHLPLSRRPLNPYTGGLPLTVDEAWVLVCLDLVDISQGSLMTWGGDSSCDNVADHDPVTGDCLCWNGALGKGEYGSKSSFEEDGPFEWWGGK